MSVGSATLGILNILIDFNMLIDTDFGIIKLIRNEYLDTSVFDVELVKRYNIIIDIIQQLYGREKYNPLTLYSSLPEEDLDELYNEFKTDKEIYKKVLDNSCITGMKDFINKCVMMGEIKITIVCKNELELEALKISPIFHSKAKLMFDIMSENPETYNQIYVKDIYSPLFEMVSKLHSKTIYLANYKFNAEETNTSVLQATLNRNIIRLMDIYDTSYFFPNI